MVPFMRKFLNQNKDFFQFVFWSVVIAAVATAAIKLGGHSGAGYPCSDGDPLSNC